MLVSFLGLVLDLVVSMVASQLVRPKNATNTSNDLVLDLVVSMVASQLVRPKNATNTSNDNSFFIVRIILGMHE